MEKIDFLLLMCVFPVVTMDGLIRIGQGIINNLGMILKVVLIGKIISFLVGIFSKPFYIAGLILLFTYFPDTVQWIFMQIGLLQLKIFMSLLIVVMPDIFGELDVNSYADIFNAGINALPPEIIDVCASLGVAENMGLIFTCLTSGWIIRIYLKAFERAGL